MTIGHVVIGSTNYTVTLPIVDGDGQPVSGLLHSTEGLILTYQRSDGELVTIPLVTLVGPTAPHVDGGFLEVSAGLYRLDLPDALWLDGATYVDLSGTGEGLVIAGGRIVLVASPTPMLEHAERQGYHPDPFDVWVPPDSVN